MAIPLVTHLAILFTHEIAFAVGLEHRDDFGQPLISHVFQFSQDTSPEEYLNVSYNTRCSLELTMKLSTALLSGN